jgi:hypothetical protein
LLSMLAATVGKAAIPPPTGAVAATGPQFSSRAIAEATGAALHMMQSSLTALETRVSSQDAGVAGVGKNLKALEEKVGGLQQALERMLELMQAQSGVPRGAGSGVGVAAGVPDAAVGLGTAASDAGAGGAGGAALLPAVPRAAPPRPGSAARREGGAGGGGGGASGGGTSGVPVAMRGQRH